MQNGVDNVAQNSRRGCDSKRFPPSFTSRLRYLNRAVKHVGAVIWSSGRKNEKTKRIAALFSRAQVPCRISENIEGDLWTKLVWNSALNAVSALGGRNMAKSLRRGCLKLFETAVYEVLAVARAAGIHPPGLEDPQAALAGRTQDCHADGGGAFLDWTRLESRERDGD